MTGEFDDSLPTVNIDEMSSVDVSRSDYSMSDALLPVMSFIRAHPDIRMLIVDIRMGREYRERLRLGIDDVSRKIDAFLKITAKEWSCLELTVVSQGPPVFYSTLTSDLVRDKKGASTIWAIVENETYYITPTQQASSRRTLLEMISDQSGKPQSKIRRGKIRFIRSQSFVLLAGTKRFRPLYKGASPTTMTERTLNHTGVMLKAACDWLLAHQSSDGEITYSYSPSDDTFSTKNNPIRQFMTTSALHRAGQMLHDSVLTNAAGINLGFNLAKFAKYIDDYAVISFGGSAKLGSSALAAMAIMEIEGISGPHAVHLDKLTRGISRLWADDGSFSTFFYPDTRNDNQNFYPGEALCFLVELWVRSQDDRLLGRILSSLSYYRVWHIGNRNPAFVPWQSTAAGTLFLHTGMEWLRDWVFEMNDWLLGFQQNDQAPFDDLRGRFYNPAHPEYGPPHASSTAVYLEGLVTAARIAHWVGECERLECYRKAIRLGLLNLTLLQFRRPEDAYYVENPVRVMGGIKTNPFDHTIRIDNVQHTIAAIVKIHEFGLAVLGKRNGEVESRQ